MAIIPKSLQPTMGTQTSGAYIPPSLRPPIRPLTLRETRLIRQYGSLENAQRQQAIQQQREMVEQEQVIQSLPKQERAKFEEYRNKVLAELDALNLKSMQTGYGLSSKDQGRKNFLDAQTRYFNEAVKGIQEGVSFEDALAYVESAGGTEMARRESVQESGIRVRAKTTSEVKSDIQKGEQLRELRQEGLSPREFSKGFESIMGRKPTQAEVQRSMKMQVRTQEIAPTYLVGGPKPAQVTQQVPFQQSQLAQDLIQRREAERYESPFQAGQPVRMVKKPEDDLGFSEIPTLSPFERYVKAPYLMSPFGVDIKVPEEYNVARETGKSRFISGLTYQEAKAALLAEKKKQQVSKAQSIAIDKFIERVEKAPEDKKYDVYTKGLELLKKQGVKTRPTIIKEFPTGSYDVVRPTITLGKEFYSSEMKTSKGFQEFQEEKEKSPLGTALLRARSIGTKGTEAYFLTRGISGAVGGISSALGGGLTYTGTGALTGTTSATIGVTGTGTSKLFSIGTGLGFTGLYGYGSYGEYKTAETPLQKRMFWDKKAGEILGFGAFATESYLKNRGIKKANVQKEIEFNKKMRRFESLKTMKKYGQYTDYADYSYRQAGIGKELSATQKNTLAKTIAKQTGISQAQAKKFIAEASVYRQGLQVRSPIGDKPYKTGKWGLSGSVKSPKGTQEIAVTFRIYKGKPTSLQLLASQSQGNYAITQTATQLRSGKWKSGDKYITKVLSSQKQRVGNVRITKPVTETRLIPKGTKITKPKEIWNNIGPTTKRASFRSVSYKYPKWEATPFGRAASKSEYRFYQMGRGKPELPTVGYGKRFQPPKSKGLQGFRITKSTVGPRTITSSKPATTLISKRPTGIGTAITRTTPKAISQFKVSPTIPTLGMGLRKPTLSFTPTQGVLGIGLIGGFGALGTRSIVSPRQVKRTKRVQEVPTIQDLFQTPQEGALDLDRVSPTTSVLTSPTTKITTPTKTGTGTVTPVPTITTSITPTTPQTVVIPEVPKIPLFGVPELPSEQPKYKKYEGYGFNAYVKQKKKWVKVTDKPNTYYGAVSEGSRFADNTVSQTFKIEPVTTTKIVKGKKQKVPKDFLNKKLPESSRYWSVAENKFRRFKVRKGKKIPLRQTFIEKKKSAIDTLGEKEGLTVARMKATATKVFFGIPTRRSPRRRRRTVRRSPFSFGI